VTKGGGEKEEGKREMGAREDEEERERREGVGKRRREKIWGSGKGGEGRREGKKGEREKEVTPPSFLPLCLKYRMSSYVPKGLD